MFLHKFLIPHHQKMATLPFQEIVNKLCEQNPDSKNCENAKKFQEICVDMYSEAKRMSISINEKCEKSYYDYRSIRSDHPIFAEQIDHVKYVLFSILHGIGRPYESDTYEQHLEMMGFDSQAIWESTQATYESYKNRLDSLISNL